MKPTLNKTHLARPDDCADKSDAPRAWQRMLSGRRLDLLNPDPADIEIADIAHGLARVARWNGQTIGDHALSVAQHVLIVDDIAAERNRDWPLQWRRAALLHDAAEYVIGDLISPFKNAIGLDYREFENRLLGAIYDRFDVPPHLPEYIAREIKTADTICAYFEATVLAGFSKDEALSFFGKPDGITDKLAGKLEKLEPQAPPHAQREFLNRFAELS